MSRGIFITATGTGIGKTVLSALIVQKLLHHAVKTAYYKPVQTGINPSLKLPRHSDADFVREFCQHPGLQTRTGYSYVLPASPHLASEQENSRITLEKIQNDFLELEASSERVIVEGAGGILVPLTRTPLILMETIPLLLKLPVILAARAGLGTINDVSLSFRHLQSIGKTPKAIFLLSELEEPDLIERDNLEILKEITGLNSIWRIPYLGEIKTEFGQTGHMEKGLEFLPDADQILEWMK
jgi:dethiobiotin synthetase